MIADSFYIVNELPEPDASDRDPNAPCPDFVWPNLVSNATTTREIFFPEHDGTLSIKCSFGGGQIYQTPEGIHEVDDRSYLILNHGQRYSTLIRRGEGVNSFTIFFRLGFAERVLRSMIAPDDHQLADPERTLPEQVLFLERPRRHDAILSPILFSLRKATLAGNVDPLWLGERFHELLEKMLLVHREVWRDVERLPAVRRSTRVEVYRRLYQAKEYMDDNYAETLTLPEIASIACLSTHHFLRSFKQLFGVTPHRYLVKRRLEAAGRLLRTTDLPVAAICYDIGFESPSSFSWLFRRTVGLSPEQFRTSRKGTRDSWSIVRVPSEGARNSNF